MAEVLLVVFANLFVAWTVTYLIHSTLMIAGARLLTRALALAPLDQVRVWRFALVAPFATAAVYAWGAGLSPSSIVLPAGAQSALADWRVCVVLLIPAAFIPVTLVFRWIRGRIALRRAFGRRRRAPVEIQQLADEMAASARCIRPFVSQSTRMLVPAAIGLREICVPSNAHTTLPRDELRALLAHELGHLARRDPLWFASLGVLRRLTVFQPLNRFALQHLRRASELAADDFAVSATSDRMALVSALTAITSGVISLSGAAMATGSPIVERAARILAAPTNELLPVGRTAKLLCVASIFAAAIWMPLGVSASPDETANRIPWLTPSKAEPNHRMLEVRRVTRAWR